MGGANITNDLAIGLKTDPEIAEKVKLTHSVAIKRDADVNCTIKEDKETFTFSSGEIDEIVEARLEEIFDLVTKELKKAGRAGRLPSGVVIVGGGANMKQIAEYAKQTLGLAARLGAPAGYGGVSEDAEKPEFAAAVGLMMIDSDGFGRTQMKNSSSKKHFSQAKGGVQKAGGAVSKFLGRFKV